MISCKGEERINKNSLLNKTLVFGVIALFVGIAFQSGISTSSMQEEKTNVEPKDYLFQTVIDIGNNPAVQKLLKQVHNEIIVSDFDYKSVFHKLLLRNPRVLTSMLFTKPKLTTEYLNFMYSNGKKMIDIIGEEKAIEIINSMKLANHKTFDDLNSIIMNDTELSNRIKTLAEMNNGLKSDSPFQDYPIICGILDAIFTPLAYKLWHFFDLVVWAYEHNNTILAYIYLQITYLYGGLCAILVFLMGLYGCIEFPPEP